MNRKKKYIYVFITEVSYWIPLTKVDRTLGAALLEFPHEFLMISWYSWSIPSNGSIL